MNKENKNEYVILCYTMALDSMLQPVANTIHARVSDIFDSIDETICRAHGLLYDLCNIDGFDGFVDGYEAFKPDNDPDHPDKVKIVHPDKVKTVVMKLDNGGYRLLLLKIESVDKLAESF